MTQQKPKPPMGMRERSQEKPVWKHKPPKLLMILNGEDLLQMLLFWLIFPLFTLLWTYLTLLSTEYHLTSQRIRFTTGVLNVSKEEVELYLIRDWYMKKPFLYRFFGLSNIYLETDDPNHPEILIKGVSDGEKILDIIRFYVQQDKKYAMHLVMLSNQMNYKQVKKLL